MKCSIWPKLWSSAGLGLMILASAAATGSETRGYLHPHRSLAAQPARFLTGPQDGDGLSLAMSLYRDRLGELGLQPGDFAETRVLSDYSDEDGTRHIVLRQRYRGLELYGLSASAHLTRDGRVISAHTNFLGNLAKITQGAARLDAVSALQAAVKGVGLTLRERPQPSPVGPDGVTRLGRAGIAEREITARLVYLPRSASVVRLAWLIELSLVTGDNDYDLVVDAEQGRLLAIRDHAIVDSFAATTTGPTRRAGASSPSLPVSSLKRSPGSYEVFALPYTGPGEGPRTIVTDPADPLYSPFGWHDTNGVAGAEHTTPRGNNVWAFGDRDGDDIPDPGSEPDAGPSLDFTGPLVSYDPSLEPDQSITASVAHLFYACNVLHDLSARHGFTEAAGNFQKFNYSGEGQANDPLLAKAQDNAYLYRDNASISVRADGISPIMRMLLWSTPQPPERDSSLCNDIIAHEFGHGISRRLTGGPDNQWVLFNDEQMGEGWSDFFALVFTAKPGDTATQPRGLANWAMSQPANGPGIRTKPYSTDFAINPYTYDRIKATQGAHSLGEVWAIMLWELYWELVGAYGFNPNFSDDWSTGGNLLALRLVIDGLKLQPDLPGFVDGRDAILLADQNLTGGANQCMIWRAFARRGLGLSADQGLSDDRYDGRESFDAPTECTYLYVAERSREICAGESAEYSLELGTAFTGPVTLELVQASPGVNVSFSANPVTALPAVVSVSVTDTAALHGPLSLTLMGDDGVHQGQLRLALRVFEQTPRTPQPFSPASGAQTGVRPIFEWEDGHGGCRSLDDLRAGLPEFGQGRSVLSMVQCIDQIEDYKKRSARYWIVEVDDDADFSSIEQTLETTLTAVNPRRPLAQGTTYWWRVRGVNACGDTVQSQVSSLTTGHDPAVLLVDDDDNEPDMQAVYLQMLADAGLNDVLMWDTENSDNEPRVAELGGFDLVVWFTGYSLWPTTGPSARSETALASFLEDGGSFFMCSQDYIIAREVTWFLRKYLGVGDVINDVSAAEVVGSVGGLYEGHGPYLLEYPFLDWSDRLIIDPDAQSAFHGPEGSVAVSKRTANYLTTFLAFPIEAIADPAERARVIQTFLSNRP